VTTWEETEDAVTPTAIRSDPLASYKKTAIGFAAILALLGIALAIYLNRRPKPSVDIVPAFNDIPTIPPAALSGLQYLPSSVNVMVAVQPSASLAFGDRGGNPREFFIAAGVPEQLIATLEQAGISLDNIGQIVVGLTFAQDKLIPAVTMVLKLNKSLDNPDAFLKSLHAEHKPIAGRPIYTTKFASMLLSPVDDKTWLFGYTDDDLTIGPAAGVTRFSPAIQDALTHRLNLSSYAWIATDNRNWSDAHPLLRAENYKKLAAKLARGRSLAADLHYDNGPRFNLDVELADAATANELRDAIQTRLPKNSVMAVDGARLTADSELKATEIGPLIQSFLSDLMK
jgi:hypothetical protein